MQIIANYHEVPDSKPGFLLGNVALVGAGDA
jgi:hypothetical protein